MADVNKAREITARPMKREKEEKEEKGKGEKRKERQREERRRGLANEGETQTAKLLRRTYLANEA